jgi:hypothetical protein
MNTELPAVLFLILGIIFIVFNGPILKWIRWLDRRTWSNKKRKLFPGFGGESGGYKPWMVVSLGLAWVGCAIVFWITSK